MSRATTIAILILDQHQKKKSEIWTLLQTELRVLVLLAYSGYLHIFTREPRSAAESTSDSVVTVVFVVVGESLPKMALLAGDGLLL